MSENERPEYLDGAAPLSAEREAELRATLTEKIRRIHEAERHPAKLWLWRNHVDGRPEYWAFDNPYPIHMDNGDPQTLGEPCGYALVKPSRNGRPDVPESVVLNSIERACARVERFHDLAEAVRKQYLREWQQGAHNNLGCTACGFQWDEPRDERHSESCIVGMAKAALDDASNVPCHEDSLVKIEEELRARGVLDVKIAFSPTAHTLPKAELARQVVTFMRAILDGKTRVIPDTECLDCGAIKTECAADCPRVRANGGNRERDVPPVVQLLPCDHRSGCGRVDECMAEQRCLGREEGNTDPTEYDTKNLLDALLSVYARSCTYATRPLHDRWVELRREVERRLGDAPKMEIPEDRDAILEEAVYAIGELDGGDPERDKALEDAMRTVSALKAGVVSEVARHD